MKKISFILLLCFIFCTYGIFAQSINPKIVFRGDINNIEKPKVDILPKTVTKIEFQINYEKNKPVSYARVYIAELDETYLSDSLGFFSFEIPVGIWKAETINIEISMRERISYKYVKLYSQGLTLDVLNESYPKKIILSKFKKVKSYTSSDGCPSF